MREQCGIYAITNQATGRQYIGSSRNCQRRFSEHLSRLRRGTHVNGKLQSSWNKHGEGAFAFALIFAVIDPDQLAAIEQHFLDEYRAVERGYNLAPTAGNTAGWRASSETRRRMSEAAKLRDNGAQQRAMAIANTGRKRRPEEMAAIWAARRANGNSLPNAEVRAKMAASAVARSRYSESDRIHMALLRFEGVGVRQIGRMFGVAHGPVLCYIKRVMKERAGWDGVGVAHE